MRTPDVFRHISNSFSNRLDQTIRKNAKVYGENYEVMSYNKDRAVFLSYKTGALYEYKEPDQIITRLDFSSEGLKYKTRLVCEAIVKSAAYGKDLTQPLEALNNLLSERVYLMRMPAKGVFPISESDRKKVFNRLMENELFVEYLSAIGKDMKAGKYLLVESMPFIGLRSREKLIKFFRDQIGLTYEQSKLLTHNLLNIGLGQKFMLERFDYKNLHKAISSHLGEPKGINLTDFIMETVTKQLLGEVEVAQTTETPQDIKKKYMTSKDIKPSSTEVEFTDADVKAGEVIPVSGTAQPGRYSVKSVDDNTGEATLTGKAGDFKVKIKKPATGGPGIPGKSIPTGKLTEAEEKEEDAEAEIEEMENEYDDAPSKETDFGSDMEGALDFAYSALSPLLDDDDLSDDEISKIEKIVEDLNDMIDGKKKDEEKDEEKDEKEDEDEEQEASDEDYVEEESEDEDDSDKDKESEEDDDESEDEEEVSEEPEAVEVDDDDIPSPEEEEEDEPSDEGEPLALTPPDEEEEKEEEENEEESDDQAPKAEGEKSSDVLVGDQYTIEDGDSINDIETQSPLLPGTYIVIDATDEQVSMVDDDGNKFIVKTSDLNAIEEVYSPIREDVNTGDIIELLTPKEGVEPVYCIEGDKVPPGYYYIEEKNESDGIFTLTLLDDKGNDTGTIYKVDFSVLDNFVKVDTAEKDEEPTEPEDDDEETQEESIQREQETLTEKKVPDPPTKATPDPELEYLPKTPFERAAMAAEADDEVPEVPDDLDLADVPEGEVLGGETAVGEGDEPLVDEEGLPIPSEDDLVGERDPLTLGEEGEEDLEVPSDEEGLDVDAELGGEGGGGEGAEEGEEGAAPSAGDPDLEAGAIEGTDFGEGVPTEDMSLEIPGGDLGPGIPGEIKAAGPEGELIEMEPGEDGAVEPDFATTQPVEDMIANMSGVEEVVPDGADGKDFGQPSSATKRPGETSNVDGSGKFASDPEAQFLWDKLGYVTGKLDELDSDTGLDGLKSSDTYQTSTETKMYKELLTDLTMKLEESPDEFTKEQVKKFLEFFVPEEELKSFYDLTAPEVASTLPDTKGEGNV